MRVRPIVRWVIGTLAHPPRERSLAGFDVRRNGHCEFVLESPRMTRAELAAIPPVFSVKRPETSYTRLDWLFSWVTALIVVVLYFSDLLWHWPRRNHPPVEGGAKRSKTRPKESETQPSPLSQSAQSGTPPDEGDSESA